MRQTDLSPMRFLALLLVLTANTLMAGEYALLRSGSRMHVDRHELNAGKVRLYLDTGSIEMEEAEILGFEADGAIPPAPPAAAGTAMQASAQLSPGELADAAADRYGLPRMLVRSVMANESAFQPGAVSPKGAIGLMQLMPDTARELGADPRDPVQNVDAGTRYLRDLLQKYGGLLWHALAAYNAGPGAVDRFNDVPPYRETLNYIKRIDRDLRNGMKIALPAYASPITAANP
jgi:soluble lytic murein transglycosylase-like protein